MADLALLEFPLHDCQLIEASAGTGKTYTIAALYVRLVLGHGVARPLLPSEILVVTFTEAATAELTDRIRRRLSEAAHVFAGVSPAKDPFLQQLRDSYAQSAWSQCAELLQLAAESMDDAAISTIHGFCYRMLTEHAFDSGRTFNLQLSTDQSELLRHASQDYWRCFYSGLDDDSFRTIQRYWATPAELLRAIEPWWHSPTPAEISLTLAPAEQIPRLLAQKQQQLLALKAPWLRYIDEIVTLLDAGREQKAFPGKNLRRDVQLRIIEHLRQWCLNEAQLWPEKWESVQKIGRQQLSSIWQGALPEHPAWQALDDLPHAIAQLPDVERYARWHAKAWIVPRFVAQQQQQGCIGFDDLLRGCLHALLGRHGERFASHIRQQFPMALIDEFQDTDPVQYELFARIYMHRQDASLLLIGDPKQAIYAFRGADIYTYLQAKRDTQGHHHQLSTNFRSSHALVAAVNQLFCHAEHRSEGWGAFLFRQSNQSAASTDNVVPFIAVKAKGRAETWCARRSDDVSQHDVQGAALAAAYLPSQDKGYGKTVYQHAMATAAATHIAELFAQGAGFRLPDGQWQPLRSRDIAILVNSQAEADLMKRALRRHGLKAVYLSDKGSVFQSPMAQELWLWLQASDKPQDEKRLRSALGCRSLGWSVTDLYALQHDEQLLEQWQQKFWHYQHIWEQQGVLPLVRVWLHDFALLPYFAQQSQGERWLTDLLHVAELLQQAAAQLDTRTALLTYLASALTEQYAVEQELTKLRLESDEALIKIVTIHKSKGLEYPLVFLPFICSNRGFDAKQRPLCYYDQHGVRQQSEQPDAHMLALAQQQWLGEELRKLYVALTRARHYCWLGLAEMREPSAMGYLLDASGKVAPGQLVDRLQAIFTPSCADPDMAEPAAAMIPSRAMLVLLPQMIAATTAQDTVGDTALDMPALTSSEMSREFSSDMSRDRGNDVDHIHRDQMDSAAGQSTVMTTNLPTTIAASTPSQVLEPYRQMPPRPRRRWWMSSYSAIAQQTDPDEAVTSWRRDGAKTSELAAELVHDVPLVSWPQEPQDTASVVSRLRQQPGAIWQQLRRGAELGTLVHDALEWAANNGFSQTLADPQAWQQWILQQLQALGWLQPQPEGGWRRWLYQFDLPDGNRFADENRALAPFMKALLGVLQQPLLAPDVAEPTNITEPQCSPITASELHHMVGVCSLATLNRYKAELDFTFSASQVQSRTLDRLVRQYLWPEYSRPVLKAQQINGMLKGFIDLCFELDGRFYVVDYKSNQLELEQNTSVELPSLDSNSVAKDITHSDGHPHEMLTSTTLSNTDSHSKNAVMDTHSAASAMPPHLQIMLQKRYDLQAAIYALALHRLLQQRKKDYQLERDIGGAMYWFLRGANATQSQFWFAIPPALICALDQLFKGDYVPVSA